MRHWCKDYPTLEAAVPADLSADSRRFNASGGPWFVPGQPFYDAQHSAGCGRLLLVEDDLSQAGLGWMARYLHAAMLLAHADRRVVMEVPARTPRWCDRPPYTLQCLFSPWSPCPVPSAPAVACASPE